MVWLVLVLLILLVFSVAAEILIMRRYRREVLAPMRAFADALESEDISMWLHDDGENRLLELTARDEEYHRLLRRIQGARIALYEQELSRQRTEVESLQLQVRPHFYISCLNLIHQFADEAGETEVVSLTEKLSDYMRAVLSLAERTTVRSELRMIRDYADIQVMRYGEANLRIDIQADEDLYDAPIPPLIFYNFFENAVLHAVTPGSPTEISVYVTSEAIAGERRIYAVISDTGPGFPAAVLASAEKAQPVLVGGEKHIGISTTIRCLKNLYGDRADVRLSNMAEGYGAIVEISLPFEETRPDGTGSAKDASDAEAAGAGVPGFPASGTGRAEGQS